MNLSPWFDDHLKPVHVGWYETRTRTPFLADQTLMRWWDGSCWRLTSKTDAVKVQYQERSWRGVLK